jgi:hypothetical protein
MTPGGLSSCWPFGGECTLSIIRVVQSDCVCLRERTDNSSGVEKRCSIDTLSFLPLQKSQHFASMNQIIYAIFSAVFGFLCVIHILLKYAHSSNYANVDSNPFRVYSSRAALHSQFSLSVYTPKSHLYSIFSFLLKCAFVHFFSPFSVLH